MARSFFLFLRDTVQYFAFSVRNPAVSKRSVRVSISKKWERVPSGRR